MNAEEYMMQYKKCRLRIERLQEQIDVLDTDCQHITSSWEGERVQSSHPPDKLGHLVARMSDLKEQMLIEVKEAFELMASIEHVIDQIDNVNYQTVLHKRYIACKKWETIGQEMHYEPRWAWELNERALREVEKLI